MVRSWPDGLSVATIRRAGRKGGGSFRRSTDVASLRQRRGGNGPLRWSTVKRSLRGVNVNNRSCQGAVVGGLVVLCMVACLGFGALLALTSTEEATPEQPTPIVTEPESVDTPEPTAGLDVRDPAYMTCSRDVGVDVHVLLQEASELFKTVSSDPLAICTSWWSGDFTARTDRLIARHDACTKPVAECLTEARSWTGMSLTALLESCLYMDQWCVTMDASDVSGLWLAVDRMEANTEFTTMATAALEKCDW